MSLRVVKLVEKLNWMVNRLNFFSLNEEQKVYTSKLVRAP